MAEAGDTSGKSRWSLKGFTALVTGGTRGIGQAVVEELAGLGSSVHTCSRNEEELNRRLKEWESKGFVVSGSVCNASSRTHREGLIQKVTSAFNGSLSILAFNFAFKGYFKTKFGRSKEKDGYIQWFAGNVASGSAAGATTSLFLYHLDYARTRLGTDTKDGSRNCGNYSVHGPVFWDLRHFKASCFSWEL